RAAHRDPAARSARYRAKGRAASRGGRRHRRTHRWARRRSGARQGPRHHHGRVIERLFAAAPVQPESKLWLWRLLSPPVRFVVSLFARTEVIGREHVPASGPYIIVANHINWKDPPMVSIALATPIRWMAKIEVFDYF